MYNFDPYNVFLAIATNIYICVCMNIYSNIYTKPVLSRWGKLTDMYTIYIYIYIYI